MTDLVTRSGRPERAVLLLGAGLPGPPGLSAGFDTVLRRLDGFITRLGKSEKTETMRFPPARNPAQSQSAGTVAELAQPAGTALCFCGGQRGHPASPRRIEGEAADAAWPATEPMLTLASCYPVYPVLAARGVLPADGHTIDVESWCYRHRPSADAGRLHWFRMREYVRVGSPEAVLAFRVRWLDRMAEISGRLCLDGRVEAAEDPPSAGPAEADCQTTRRLRLELLVPLGDPAAPVACVGFNYHRDLFGNLCGLTLPDGATAHSACVGFALERLVLALFRAHGFDVAGWPARLRRTLSM